MNFTPFPNLSSERLLLRQVKIEDDNEIFFLRSDERVMKFIDRPFAKDIKEAHEFINKITNGIINNEWIYWAVTTSNSPKLIGTVCLWNFNNEGSEAEIGYELHPNYQGKGIMQEAVKEVINYGFNTLKINLISAFTHQDNSKSTMLLKKNGFVFYKKSEDSFIYNLFNNLSDE